MALTNQQLLSLGFKPSVRGRGGLTKNKRYDSLILPINDTDFLYTGYNPFKKQVNYKTIWKSFKDAEGNRISYQVVNLSDTGFTELKSYIDRSKVTYEVDLVGVDRDSTLSPLKDTREYPEDTLIDIAISSKTPEIDG